MEPTDLVNKCAGFQRAQLACRLVPNSTNNTCLCPQHTHCANNACPNPTQLVKEGSKNSNMHASLAHPHCIYKHTCLQQQYTLVGSQTRKTCGRGARKPVADATSIHTTTVLRIIVKLRWHLNNCEQCGSAIVGCLASCRAYVAAPVT